MTDTDTNVKIFSSIADNALAAANATDRKKSLADVIDVVGTSRYILQSVL